ncbi:MAG: hypothetical protein FWG25_02750 [Promicromonosporaceae bacterium]|nr:hypothetical protein [Promicromonosporaceae bacterium]
MPGLVGFARFGARFDGREPTGFEVPLVPGRGGRCRSACALPLLVACHDNNFRVRKQSAQYTASNRIATWLNGAEQRLALDHAGSPPWAPVAPYRRAGVPRPGVSGAGCHSRARSGPWAAPRAPIARWEVGHHGGHETDPVPVAPPAPVRNTAIAR